MTLKGRAGRTMLVAARGHLPRKGPRARRLLLAAIAIATLTGSLGLSHGSIPEDPNQQLWGAVYDGPGDSYYDGASSVAVSPDGSTVYVTGRSVGSGSSVDYATIAYSVASGEQLWGASYDGTDDFASSLVVSPDGSKVFVTGFRSVSGSTDYATVAYAATDGARLWVAGYDGPGNFNDFASSLAVSPDSSTVFVTGRSTGSGTYDDYATVAYSTTDGAELWNARYDGPGNYDDYASSLAVSPDGSTVFVAGRSWRSETRDNYATVAYAATSGEQLWAAAYDGPGNDDDYAASLVVSPDGSTVVVTGRSVGSGSVDYLTVGYSATSGAEVWVARYDGPAESTDIARSIVVSPDGSKVFVTGFDSRSLGSFNYATVAYAATDGAQLWVARYSYSDSDTGRDYDLATSVGVSPDGSKVFVTGTSYEDYATVAYSATDGVELWVARYNGQGNSYDVAYSLAVGPDGSKVFVTGSSGFGSSTNYATVAYRSSSCANGHEEAGSVSDTVHEVVEPVAATPYVHGANCDVVAANGL